MSVNPVASTQWTDLPQKASEPGTTTSSVPFDEYLAAQAGTAGNGAPVSAATAAEVLRLKMLSSALSLGNEQGAPASAQSQGVQGLLDKFLAQLPKGGLPDQPASTEAAGSVAELTGGDTSLGPNPSIAAVIDKASKRYGVDANLIRAVIKQESNFNPRAVSSAGAQGLMQLMPATARGLGVTDSFDPEQNVMAGTRFLKDMLQRYGNVDEALAAYNWGPGNVDRHGTGSLPRETRDYLAKVKGFYGQNVA
jgi:soluble lytic murein transglycosylase-like protein